MKTAVFIDGANFYASLKLLEIDIDYKRVLKYVGTEHGTLIRANYYSSLSDSEEFNGMVRLIDFLSYNGYNTVTKPTKEFTDLKGQRKIKGNMDIELAVDMLELADHVEHIMLFSGDGDFRRVVDAVQRRGVRVTVVSTIASHPPMAADELRRQADAFIDIKSVKAKIEKIENVDAPPAPPEPPPVREIREGVRVGAPSAWPRR